MAPLYHRSISRSHTQEYIRTTYVLGLLRDQCCCCCTLDRWRRNDYLVVRGRRQRNARIKRETKKSDIGRQRTFFFLILRRLRSERVRAVWRARNALFHFSSTGLDISRLRLSVGFWFPQKLLFIPRVSSREKNMSDFSQKLQHPFKNFVFF